MNDLWADKATVDKMMSWWNGQEPNKWNHKECLISLKCGKIQLMTETVILFNGSCRITF